MPADCQPLLPRKQRRRVLHAARLRCTALAAAASAGPAEPRERQARQSWGEAWRAWWSVAPTPKQSEAAAAPQSLRRVVAKLWKVLNINKLQLFGALLFMVRHTSRLRWPNSQRTSTSRCHCLVQLCA
jgi:hypothetical protein